jgi:hypothetical protein
MKKFLIPTLVAPILMAWGLTAFLFGSLTGGGSYAGHETGFGEVFASFTIMFCIAVWIGALATYLLIKHNQSQV